MAKWIRKGECSHCGWCCVFSFDPILMFFPKGDARRDEFLKVRGFREAVNEGVPGFISSAEAYRPCPQHVNNKCAIYDNRPQVCREFPHNPDQIKNTPCSYWFEDADQKELPIGGDASPYGKSFENFRLTQKMAPPVREGEE